MAGAKIQVSEMARDGNQLLPIREQKEWKTYRTMVSSNPRLSFILDGFHSFSHLEREFRQHIRLPATTEL